MEHLKSFVLRSGRMSNLQKRSYDQLYSRYCIEFKRELLDVEQLFPSEKFRHIIMEIGFGMGIATAAIADKNPETGFICTEVFTAGVGKLLSEIERRPLKNIAIVQHDAYDVVSYMLPDNFLQGVHVFFPDPWPKKKHHKRRLIQPSFLTLLASKIRDRGYLYLVTDWEDYAYSMLESINAVPDLSIADEAFAVPASWRPQTRFEKKAVEKGRPVFEIQCRKV